MSVKILAVGDICGAPGLDHLAKVLRNYRREQGIDFVVANGENANVVGITPKQADQILHAGVDVITLGNHTWTRTELQPYLDERSKILRPANYGPQCPGRGIAVYHAPFGDLCVLNLLSLPKGCRFCTRCDKAMKICTEYEPDLYDIGDGHKVRCFLANKEVMASGK